MFEFLLRWNCYAPIHILNTQSCFYFFFFSTINRKSEEKKKRGFRCVLNSHLFWSSSFSWRSWLSSERVVLSALFRELIWERSSCSSWRLACRSAFSFFTSCSRLHTRSQHVSLTNWKTHHQVQLCFGKSVACTSNLLYTICHRIQYLVIWTSPPTTIALSGTAPHYLNTLLKA